MSHDLLAELAGYTSELANYQRSGRDERAAAVRDEISRVTGQINTRIEQLLTAAEGHEDAGADLAAAQARVEAKQLAAALPAEHRPARLRALYPDEAGAENAEAAAAPAEKAVPRKRAAAKADGGEAGA
jgi:hypothetical protein